MVKHPPANEGDIRDAGLIPGWGRIPWRRKWQPTPVFLLGESHGQRSLANYSPWGCKESDMTKKLSLSYFYMEKEMATRSNILAWESPWTEKPGGL